MKRKVIVISYYQLILFDYLCNPLDVLLKRGPLVIRFNESMCFSSIFFFVCFKFDELVAFRAIHVISLEQLRIRTKKKLKLISIQIFSCQI